MGALGGSWGALGVILAHEGPKSQHKFKKSGSLAPRGPPSWGHLGAQVGLMLEHVGEKRVSQHSWKTCCFETSFFQRNLSSQGPSWTPKIKQNHGRVAKNYVFGFPLKVALGRGLGAPFGRVFGPKLGPSWAKLGPCWNRNPTRKDNKKTLKNLSKTRGSKEPGKQTSKLDGPPASP